MIPRSVYGDTYYLLQNQINFEYQTNNSRSQLISLQALD